jgi:hypothetical protein
LLLTVSSFLLHENSKTDKRIETNIFFICSKFRK